MSAAVKALERSLAVRRVLGGLLVANIVVVLAKATIGMLAGSLAVLGDAVHSSVDAVYNVLDQSHFVPISILTTLAPVLAAAWPADPQRLMRTSRRIVELLSADAPETQIAAAIVLGELGVKDAAAVDGLLSALERLRDGEC